MAAAYNSAIEQLKESDGSSLIRLVYVSSLSIKGRLNSSVTRDIEKESKQNNKAKGITGVLCYGKGNFLQCLEGTKDAVLRLLERIFNDPRHKNFKICLVELIEHYTFFDWNMRSIFLERWMWSKSTKKQNGHLAQYLPFKPHDWDKALVVRFLNDLKQFKTSPSKVSPKIKFNAFGNMISYIVAPHQAFIVVQSVLTVLITTAVIFMF